MYPAIPQIKDLELVLIVILNRILPSTSRKKFVVARLIPPLYTSTDNPSSLIRERALPGIALLAGTLEASSLMVSVD